MRKNYLRALAHVSPADFWQRCSNPAMIPVAIQSPPSTSIDDIPIGLFQGVDAKQVRDYRLDLLTNHKFFHAVNERFTVVRERRVKCDGWHELLYVLIRLSRPQIVIETGIFDGLSSSVILQAMYDNGSGQCISIDLPAVETIKGSTDRMLSKTLPPNFQPGWIVPDYLRRQHQILLGDSKELLPQALRQHATIDMFLHDSLHTYEHQMFEYEAAWQHLSSGGLLLSDDISWSPAFHRFCRAKGCAYKRFNDFGVVRKTVPS
jgi:predicted O-methyltransferase YrrM